MDIRRTELEDEDWMMGTRDRRHWRNIALEIMARVYRDGHQKDGVRRRELDDGGRDRRHWRNIALEIMTRVYRDVHQED